MKSNVPSYRGAHFPAFHLFIHHSSINRFLNTDVLCLGTRDSKRLKHGWGDWGIRGPLQFSVVVVVMALLEGVCGSVGGGICNPDIFRGGQSEKSALNKSCQNWVMQINWSWLRVNGGGCDCGEAVGEGRAPGIRSCLCGDQSSWSGNCKHFSLGAAGMWGGWGMRQCGTSFPRTLVLFWRSCGTIERAEAKEWLV